MGERVSVRRGLVVLMKDSKLKTMDFIFQLFAEMTDGVEAFESSDKMKSESCNANGALVLNEEFAAAPVNIFSYVNFH